MTQISDDDVRHLAQLSNLQLSDDEAATLRPELEHILEYVEQLSELDTEGVEPTYQVTELENVWRDDTIDTYGLGGDVLVALAPEKESGQVKVPKVL